MHTITFYPKSNPSLDEVKEFVRPFPEGDWVAETECCRGVIESEDGRIYLDYDEHYREYFDKYLGERQRAELTARLGLSPTLAVHVHTSHAYKYSREFAQIICENLTQKWGGGWSE